MCFTDGSVGVYKVTYFHSRGGGGKNQAVKEENKVGKKGKEEEGEEKKGREEGRKAMEKEEGREKGSEIREKWEVGEGNQVSGKFIHS